MSNKLKQTKYYNEDANKYDLIRKKKSLRRKSPLREECPAEILDEKRSSGRLTFPSAMANELKIAEFRKRSTNENERDCALQCQEKNGSEFEMVTEELRQIPRNL